MKQILTIEDDRVISEMVRYVLEKEGFQVVSAQDGLTGITRVKEIPLDLLILDLMLPGLSGLEICKRIRTDQSLNRLPILILSARGQETDRVTALELGADDYITKPFSPREFVARVKALLRRADPPVEAEKPIKIGPLIIDSMSYTVTRDGKPVRLSTLEFRLLYFLVSHPNKVFFPRSHTGRHVGHCRAAPERGYLHPALADKNRTRSGESSLLEDRTRCRLQV